MSHANNLHDAKDALKVISTSIQGQTNDISGKVEPEKVSEAKPNQVKVAQPWRRKVFGKVQGIQTIKIQHPLQTVCLLENHNFLFPWESICLSWNLQLLVYLFLLLRISSPLFLLKASLFYQFISKFLLTLYRKLRKTLIRI